MKTKLKYKLFLILVLLHVPVWGEDTSKDEKIIRNLEFLTVFEMLKSSVTAEDLLKLEELDKERAKMKERNKRKRRVRGRKKS